MAGAQIARNRTPRRRSARSSRGRRAADGQRHARTDIGVPFWFRRKARDVRKHRLIERDDAGDQASAFRRVIFTARAERKDLRRSAQEDGQTAPGK
jgi:hypothetical protein